MRAPCSFLLTAVFGKVFILLTAALFLRPVVVLAAADVTPEGQHLAAMLDAMHVEEHWIAGAIVDWRTGDPTGKPLKEGDTGKHTHCSQFSAAACEKLGIYILRPPEHGAVLLANAQFDWLSSEGRAKGWTPVADGVAAQDLANRGQIVVAVCQNHDPKKSGHIAIVRPGKKTPVQIAAEGPDVIQAGGTNYNSASLKRGFANHPDAFPKGEIRYYMHPVEAGR
ncbi:conserved hypothetical protein [Chthoniobacter flavus Ellin428]|uniref:Uncharacterized protein n=1 Tax=Chthoniobacter flavus Ellin428 TaxID=497964 RepID=B4D3B5_9BACT|nr:hypothetical protein [Chthoniobacter flavus]EDY19226.1 conserved hypothetical protein [Chthoniobacter flavus Ellin428]TCO88069.1 hypothetical protein EV701_119113 [Chthoniobacter flavus]